MIKTKTKTKTELATNSSSPRQATSQACAACKYQRRRCTPECALAPYFPAEAQRQFLNAHRLFGVSNIHKLLRALGPDPRQRADAMRSIVYHSNARAADPVGGCYRIVLDLERHCAAAAADLSLLLHHLALYRTHHHYSNNNNNNNNVVSVDDQFNIPVVEEAQYLEYLDGNYNYNNNNDVSYISSSGSSVDNIVRDHGGNNGVELEVLQSTMSNLAEEEEDVATDDDAKPRFMEMIDVMGNTLVGLEPYEVEVEDEQGEITSAIAHGSFHCSPNMVSNEEPNPIENVQEHALIEAASFFTLTSNNSSYV